MIRPNAIDQRVQSVLYLMDIPIGRTGIDGQTGDNTLMGMHIAANRINATLGANMTVAEAAAAGLKGSANRADMEKIILDKLKDPKFREVALEKLKQIDPPTKDSIIAMQTILGAAGHDTTGMRDPVTGMMNGKMNEATRLALNNTEGGKPIAAAYAQAGIPSSAIQVAMNARPSELNQNFQTAVDGTVQQPAQMAVKTSKPAIVVEAKI